MTAKDLEQLRSLLIEYDRGMGHYPESEWQGKSVWEFLRAKFPEAPQDDSDTVWFKAGLLRW